MCTKSFLNVSAFVITKMGSLNNIVLVKRIQYVLHTYINTSNLNATICMYFAIQNSAGNQK